MILLISFLVVGFIVGALVGAGLTRIQLYSTISKAEENLQNVKELQKEVKQQLEQVKTLRKALQRMERK